MRKLPMFCLASALAFQSMTALAEPSKGEKAAAVGAVGATFATVYAVGAVRVSKANGPVPNEKPLAAYGKEISFRQRLGEVIPNPVQIVGEPVVHIEEGSESPRRLVFNKKTGDIYVDEHPFNLTRTHIENRDAGAAKIVQARFYAYDRVVVTLDEKGIVRKYSADNGTPIKIEDAEAKVIAKYLKSSQTVPMKVIRELEKPAFLEDVEHYERVYEVEGKLKNIRTVEIGKAAHVKKAIADFSKRLGGPKGYAKLTATAVVPSAVTAGFLYAGDNKREDLAEVGNAPQAQNLEQVEAARGEK